MSDVSETEVREVLLEAIWSLRQAPSPDLRRDEVIRIACQRMDLSPLDDDMLLVLGAYLDELRTTGALWP